MNNPGLKEDNRMIVNIKILTILVVFSFLYCASFTSSYAATINAESPSQPDVAAAIASSSYGDTVYVPSGSATWTKNIQIKECITLEGAGIGKTIIDGNYDDALVFINANEQSINDNCAFRVTGFTFDGNWVGTKSTGVAVWQQHSLDLVPQNIRIHNNEFKNFRRAGITFNQSKGHSFGLIDNNIFTNCRKALNSYGWYTYSLERLPSAQESLGTVNNIYFEDNTINFNDTRDMNATISSGHGGRWVARFNTINYNETTYLQGHDVHGNNGNSIANNLPVDCATEEHSDCAGGNRGVMVAESYNNTHNFENMLRNLKAMDIRGATVMVFNERYVESDGSHAGYIQIREEDGPSSDNLCLGSTIPEAWGTCIDPVRDTYIFNNRNTYSDTEANVSEYKPQHEFVEPDYNYWKYNASFNGTTGVGVGILANRPAVCNKGVGYWATDKGTWNTTGDDGVLYKCTSTDTWTLYYEPYTYPHPLRNGQIVRPNAPLNLQIVKIN